MDIPARFRSLAGGGLVLLAVAAVVGAVPAPPASAESAAEAETAAPVVADYTCSIEGDPAPEPVSVSLTLDGPTSPVSPGDVVSLAGQLTITYPRAVAVSSQLTLGSKSAMGDTLFQPEVRVGKRTQPLTATVLPESPAPIKDPFTLSADIRFADFTVPGGDVDELVVTMPRRATIENPVPPTPPKVAFTTAIELDSPVTPTRAVGCWPTPAEPMPPLARIKVAPGGSDDTDAPPADTGPPPPAPELGPGSSTGAAPPAPPAPADVPSGEAPPPTPAGDAPRTTTTTAELQAAAIPEPTSMSGTFIPYWEVALMGAFLPVTAMGLAIAQRRRLARARRLLRNN